MLANRIIMRRRADGGGGDISPVSYLILIDNTRIDFELVNTPIANFCANTAATTSITVNGVAVTKNTIKKIVFGASYLGVETIGNHFLYYCTSIVTANILGLAGVETVGTYFFFNCNSMTSVLLSPSMNISLIDIQVFSSCSKLTSLDLGVFRNLGILPNAFLYNCSDIVSLDFFKLTPVTKIGNQAFQGIEKILTINLEPFSEVESIGSFFLASWQMTSIDLGYLEFLSSIGTYFLAYCTQLTSISIGQLDFNYISVGRNGFAGSVPNDPTCIIYADSIAKGNAFKSKFPNLSSWTVEEI